VERNTKAELPEIKKEDVKVTVHDGVFKLIGERKLEKEGKWAKGHRAERTYGKFSRSLSLPDDADGNKAKADVKDGLLNVHVRKSEQAILKSSEVKIK